jgi:hypothetical protein
MKDKFPSLRNVVKRTLTGVVNLALIFMVSGELTSFKVQLFQRIDPDRRAD